LSAQLHGEAHRDIPRIVKEAFYIARTGRPAGLIDIPKDMARRSVSFIRISEPARLQPNAARRADQSRRAS
jgi:acetolactate synthase-1/2/3 large subunit